MRARSPRAALATIFVEGLLGRLTFGMVSFALPLYAYHLGLSLAEIGVIVSTRSAFELPLKPIAGWLVDKTSVRAVYIGGIAMRCVSAAVLVLAGDFASLCLVRALHGASAAGRDVGSLSVLARDSGERVGTHYGWYTTVRQIGNVGGAGLAGLLIAADGGAFGLVFAAVAVMSILPLIVAAVALREAPAAPAVTAEPVRAAPDPEPTVRAPEAAPRLPRRRRARAALAASYAGLGGAASVGMLVAASAYMVHGIFPVLATTYAGLSNAQAGLIYAISTAVFCVAGPVFGWLSDRSGRAVALSLRSVCNVASSLLYVVLPSFAGLTVARCVDDSGKAAFRPAWASYITELASADRARQGRRLGALDTATSFGELVGPILAGILWQTGGILALFGVRIVIAIIAEIAALRVFHQLGRPRIAHRPPPDVLGRAPVAASR
jgi:MFS family permease